MYFLQIIILNFFPVPYAAIKISGMPAVLHLIITERREYQKIVYYINKKSGRCLNSS